MYTNIFINQNPPVNILILSIYSYRLIIRRRTRNVSMQQTLEKWLIRIIRGLIFLAILSPVVFYPDFYFPHAVPKAIWFQVTTELALLFFIILASFYPKYRPRSSLITWAVIFFFASQFLAVSTSQTPLTSFLGNFARSWGFWHILHFAFLYIITSSLFHGEKLWRFLLGISLLLSSVLAIIGLYLIIAEKNFINFAGNSTYVSIYLYFNMFFSLWFASRTKSSWKKWFFVTLGIFHILVISMIGTRGVLLALGLIILASLIYLGIKGQERLKKNARIILALFIVSYIGLFILKDTNFVKNITPFERITNISLQDKTLQSRFFLWRIGLQGFFDKPLTGWGQENFSLVYEKYYDPRFYSIGLGENWEDRSHNGFIDYLVQSGIVGGVAYLFFLIIPLIELKNINLKKIQKWEVYGLGAIIVGYAIQVFFFFDNLMGFIPLILVLAYINNLSHQETFFPKKTLPFISYLISLLAILVILPSIYLMNIKPLLGNYYFVKAYRAFILHKDDEYKRYYEQGKNNLALFNVSNQNVLLAFLELVYTFSRKNNIHFNIIPILQDLEELDVATPDLFATYNAGRYYLNEWENLKKDEYARKAYELSSKLNRQYPKRQFFAILTAQSLAAIGQYEDGVSLLREMQNLAPDKGKLSWHLSKIYTKVNRLIDAGFEMQKALLAGYRPDNLDGYLYAGDLLMNSNLSPEMAIQVYNMAAVAYPDKVISYERLMYAYISIGDSQKALLSARAILLKDPSKDDEIKQFLEKNFKQNKIHTQSFDKFKD